MAFEPKSQAPASKGKKTQGSKKTTTTTKPEDDKTKGSTVAPASVPSSSGGVPPTLKYPTDEETAARKAAAEAAMREDPSVFDEGDDLEAEIDAGLRELAKTDLALGPTWGSIVTDVVEIGASLNCGVNPATGLPGIKLDPVKNPRIDRRPGGVGNLRPGRGGAGGFRERTGAKHDGNDIVAPIGSPVFANRAGTIKVSGWIKGYGNTVIIDHGGVNTLYAHLSGISTGQVVSQGQVIGKAGVTGNAGSLVNMPNEQHVHFGVFTGAPTLPPGGSSRWLNPATYLNNPCPP